MKTIVVFLESGVGEIVPVLRRCLMLLPTVNGRLLLGRVQETGANGDGPQVVRSGHWCLLLM